MSDSGRAFGIVILIIFYLINLIEYERWKL